MDRRSLLLEKVEELRGINFAIGSVSQTIEDLSANNLFDEGVVSEFHSLGLNRAITALSRYETKVIERIAELSQS